MNTFYVPYSAGEVASIDINGHAFLVLAREREVLEEHLDLLGADSLEVVENLHGAEEDVFLSSLASKVDGGIVIAAGDGELEQIIESLRAEVPWVQ